MNKYSLPFKFQDVFFSRYIAFATYLDYTMSKYIAKAMVVQNCFIDINEH